MRHLTLIAFLLCYGATTVAESPPPRVGVLACGISDFWTTMRDAMLENAEGRSVTVDFRMPSPATVEQQQELATQMLAAGINALAICPVKPDEQKDFLNDLAASIPLITLATDAPDSARRLHIGRDASAAGALLGNLINDNMVEGFKVMAFCAKPDAPDMKQLITALKTELDKTDTILDDVIVDHGDRMLAAANISDVLTRRPEIAALIGLNEYHAPALVRAIVDSSRAQWVRLFCVDSDSQFSNAIAQGNAHGAVINDPGGWALLALDVLKALATQDDTLEIPESGLMAAPIKIQQGTIVLDPEEVMDALQVQVPWISEVVGNMP